MGLSGLTLKMEMWDNVIKFKNIIMSFVAVTALCITMLNYFTPASVFANHVKKQELKELRAITIQYELNYKCYKQSCQSKMAPELYIEYQKMLARIEELGRE